MMAIVGSTDLGSMSLFITVDHNPTAVATDAPKGSIIQEKSTGKLFRKTDDGSTTSVVEIAA